MSQRNSSNSEEKKNFFTRKPFILLVGIGVGAGLMIGTYKASVYFSSDDSCMMCHVHPHVYDSW